MTNIEQAIRTVPPSDYPGADLSGVPRPPGWVRSWYAVSTRVTTIIYSGHSTVPVTQTDLQARLAAVGWRTVTAPGASPRPVSSATAAWSALMVKGKQVLQLSIFQNGGVTAAAYIVQTSP